MKSVTRKSISVLCAAALGITALVATSTGASAYSGNGIKSCGSAYMPRLITTRGTMSIPVDTGHEWDYGAVNLWSQAQTFGTNYPPKSSAHYSWVTVADSMISVTTACPLRPV